MIGIISDIHGNLAALQAVLQALDATSIKRIVCLGDTAGYYSQINECCYLLRARGILSLLGNHDHYLATGNPCPRSTSANVCLEFQRSIITMENLNWLNCLEPSAQVEGIEMVHGGWMDPLDEYFRPSEEYFSHETGVAFVSGHTHVACLWSGKNKVYCNPGSVGQPRDGDWRAAFATWDGQRFALHRVPYDVGATSRAMELAGFESYYSENLASGTRIGGRIDSIDSVGR